MNQYKNLDTGEIKTLPQWKEWARIRNYSITFSLGNIDEIKIVEDNKLIAICKLIKNGRNKNGKLPINRKRIA